MSSEESHQAHFLAKLNDGREVKCLPCDCGHCGVEFFMPMTSTGISRDWEPSYCPGCGVKFSRVVRSNEPIVKGDE